MEEASATILANKRKAKLKGNTGASERGRPPEQSRNEHEAAEKACGVTLTATQRPQMYLRADVRIAQRMNDHHHFYAVIGQM